MPYGQRRIYKMDKVQKAEERIKSNPWDSEAWSVLLRDAQTKLVDESRPVFERIVTQFPMAGQYWKSYIQQEMKSRNYEKVERLFQRCLIKILYIDLWKLYLQYIKETKGSQPAFKEKMAQAYDFALEKMGLDLNSYPIWADYIAFLKKTTVVGTYAESQKITATRRVYQRAIITPMIGIETIWRDYVMYENSINPQIAKKFTEERSRDYMNARRVAKEYEIVTKGLNRNLASVPPNNSPEEVKQVELWKRYIQWEKENPLGTEDVITITRRVMFAYEQCLLCLSHHPDVWYEAASYLEQASKVLNEKGDQSTSKKFADEVATIYERSLQVLKENMLLYFAYADYEEGRCKYEKVHTIYKKLISMENVVATLPYIQYMRFCRRAEGIRAARRIFKLARQDKRISYHVYVAAAWMEYYCSKDKELGHRIFEIGMNRFSHLADYVAQYVDYMSHLNEDNDTRVLFERAVASTLALHDDPDNNGNAPQIPLDKTRLLWSKFLQLECSVGDLASIVKVERRRRDAFQRFKEFQARETALSIDRYRFLDLYPCSEVELRALGHRDIGSTSGFESGMLSVADATTGVTSAADIRTTDTAITGYGRSHATGGSFPGGIGALYPQPDVNQMLAFKPKAHPRTGSHVVPGGEFPPPPAASALLKLLPPPLSFHGPFVLVDKFMQHMETITLPSDWVQQQVPDIDDRGIDAGTALSIELAASGHVARKRRLLHTPAGMSVSLGGMGGVNVNSTATGGNPNPDSDEDDMAVAGASAPMHDIYRHRQAKRAKLTP